MKRIKTEVTVEQIAKSQRALLAKLIQDGLDTLVAGQKIELEGDNLITGYYGGVTCEPTIFERKSIGHIYEKAGWTISRVHISHATRWEPENCDVQEVFTSDNLIGVASYFVKVVAEMLSDDYWQKICDDDYAKQEEQWQ